MKRKSTLKKFLMDELTILKETVRILRKTLSLLSALEEPSNSTINKPKLTFFSILNTLYFLFKYFLYFNFFPLFMKTSSKSSTNTFS